MAVKNKRNVEKIRQLQRAIHSLNVEIEKLNELASEHYNNPNFYTSRQKKTVLDNIIKLDKMKLYTEEKYKRSLN